MVILMRMLNHVQIKVKSLNRSRKFYDKVMSVLGYNVVLEIEDVVVGYGTNVYDMFEIRQSTKEAPLSQYVHIAFNASSIENVNTFHCAALESGAKCNGKPGFRDQYEKGYYASFVIDPDGHNIEAVFIENKTI